MGSPADHSVEVLLQVAELHVDPHQFGGVHAAYDVLKHLIIAAGFVIVGVFGYLFAGLQSG